MSDTSDRVRGLFREADDAMGKLADPVGEALFGRPAYATIGNNMDDVGVNIYRIQQNNPPTYKGAGRNPELPAAPPNSGVLLEDEIAEILSEEGLDTDEFLTAVSEWTSGSEKYTQAQRSTRTQWEEIGLENDWDARMGTVEALEEGLETLPPYTGGTIYRGINLDSLANFEGFNDASQVVEFQSLQSFSRTPEDWRIQNRNTVIVVNNNQSGVALEEISKARREGEVLVPSNTVYHVVEIIENPVVDKFGQNTKWVITLEEVVGE